MPLNKGQLYYSSVGIIDVEEFYTEDGVDKVRIRLHHTKPEDGVTPVGSSVLMSTTQAVLEDWIDQFPKDLAERKKVAEARRAKYPEQSARVLVALDKAKRIGKPDRKELK